MQMLGFVKGTKVAAGTIFGFFAVNLRPQRSINFLSTYSVSFLKKNLDDNFDKTYIKPMPGGISTGTFRGFALGVADIWLRGKQSLTTCEKMFVSEQCKFG